MKKAMMSLALVAAASTGAFAQCNIDQNADTNNAYMAAFAQGDLAQSFQHQNSDNICGAGIFLQPGVGSSDNVEIQLWDALPNGGGNMLATGSAIGNAGEWVDVEWNPVSITPNTTYYLVFTGNTSLGISGDVTNQYPYGHVFANPGFNPFPSFDYTFRTYSGTTAGLSLEVNGDCPGTIFVSWSGATPNSDMGVVFAYNEGSFVVPGGPCAGTELGLGRGGLRLATVLDSGSGSGRAEGRVVACACGGFLQLIVVENPCTTSNVAQIP